MKTRLRLFPDWGITFDGVFTVPEKAQRKVAYADKQILEQNIINKHTAVVAVDEDTGEVLNAPSGTGALHTPVADKAIESRHRPVRT